MGNSSSLRWIVFLCAAATLLTIGAFIWARPMIESLFFSALLAYLIDPAVRRVETRWKWSRQAAANIMFVATIVILLGLASGVSAILWDRIPQIQAELLDAWQEISDWSAQPVFVLGIPIHMQPILRNLQQSTITAVTALPSGSTSILGQITDNLLWSTVILVSLYYFLKDGPRIKPWLVAVMPVEYRDQGRPILDEIDHVWSVFLRIQLLIFLILAILLVTSTGLILFLYHNGWLNLSPVGLGILIVLVYTGIQQVDNLLLRPQLLGSRFRLHPGVVFVALISALAIGGVTGALVIVPLIATIKVIVSRLRTIFLHESPGPAEAEAEPQTVVSVAPEQNQPADLAPNLGAQPQLSGYAEERLAAISIAPEQNQPADFAPSFGAQPQLAGYPQERLAEPE